MLWQCRVRRLGQASPVGTQARQPYIAQMRGASPFNPHITSRQATRTALSSFIAGSTCGASTRTTTMRSLGLVAPAVAPSFTAAE